MNNFVAIDVETANNHRTSICAVGAVKVIDGAIAGSFYRLVRPQPNFYFRHFTDNIHGISRAMTDDAPDFGELWPELKDFIGELPLVAHNATFDCSCLKATARAYGIEWPEPEFLCTLQAARRTCPKTLCGSHSLPYVADFLGIPFSNHHNALADAEACAKIAMTIL